MWEAAMANDRKRKDDDRKPQSRAEDQLSPARAVRESVGKGGQRVGDSGPIANPTVSFPEGSEDTKPTRSDDVGEC
jgi:hypothetical protein